MLNRGAFRIISLALVLAVLSVAAIYNADAQGPPHGQLPGDFFRGAVGDRLFSLRA